MISIRLSVVVLAGATYFLLTGHVVAEPNPAAADAADTQGSAGELAEITVTAQRRSENLERTPVAIEVVSGEELKKQDIVTESDLQIAVPGLTVRGSTNGNQLNYSIRGQTLDAFSSSHPAVVPYINEIAINSGTGASAFYDLSSVQVLKGPQGTLFGRNTTGGAVLFTTAKPTDTFQGYVSASTGDYGLAQFEGMVSGPLIGDTLLGRLAAFSEDRTGVQYNTFYDVHDGAVARHGVRGSITVNFSDTIKNDTVVEYQRAGGTSNGLVALNTLPVDSPITGIVPLPANVLYTPAGFNSVFGPNAWAAYLAAHPNVTPGGMFVFQALQDARGPFTISDWNQSFHRSNNLLVSNVTSIDILTDLKFKNILGFNNLRSGDGDDATGTPYAIDGTPLDDPYGLGKFLKEFSEEPQLLGKAFGGNLSYVTGLYYSDDKDIELIGSTLADFAPISPAVTQHSNSTNRDKSYAEYAQGTYDLSGVTGVQGLGMTAGARYTTEEVSIQQIAGSAYYNAGPPFQDLLSDTFRKVSWQFGVQEQLSNDLLLYLVSRHSFRSGGFNTAGPALPGFGSSGGDEFKPETATDVELGTKFQSSVDGLPIRLNAALYSQTIKDVQRVIYTRYIGALAGLTANVPEARVSGVELDGQINLAKWLSVGTSLTYTDAKFTNNQATVFGSDANGAIISSTVAFGPYPDTPRYSGSIYAEASAPVSQDLEISARADEFAQTMTYIDSTENELTPGAEIPGYAVANFHLALANHRQGWTVAAGVKNAFNKAYYVGGLGVASFFTVNSALPADPRTFMVTLRKDF